MPARIVAVVNQKGGSSKTTLSIQLAGTLARRGLKSLIVDADPQGPPRVGPRLRLMRRPFLLPCWA